MVDNTFEDLEKRCKSINKRRYAKWILTLFAIFVFLVIAVLVYFKFTLNGYMDTRKNVKQHIKTKTKEVKKPKTAAQSKKIVTPKKVSQTDVATKKIEVKKAIKKDTVLPKAEQVKKNLKEKQTGYSRVFFSPNIVIPKDLESKEIDENISKNTVKKIDTIQKSKVVEKKKVVIKVKSFKNEKSLLKDNGVDESFETTIKLANYYFEKSKFKKAIYWLKKANRHKPSSFDPWFIYAKIKIKQHKKDEAIKAVETFLSYFNSNDARKFLINIKGEKK